MIQVCTKCGYEWEYDFVIPEVCPKCGDGHIMVVNNEEHSAKEKK